MVNRTNMLANVLEKNEILSW